MNAPIAFNVPQIAGREIANVMELLGSANWTSGGTFTQRAQEQLQALTGSAAPPLLTNSATAALDIMALASKLQPGDEVIMPSFTFASTANAFAKVGAVPVFVDVRLDTQNIDEALVEEAITGKTRAICAVHYAGVCAEMAPLLKISAKRNHVTLVFEDAAQALLSSYHARQAGSFGDMAAVSFHATKGITCGEGGALFFKPMFQHGVEVAFNKGTDLASFRRGEQRNYSWADLGAASAMNEITAAVLSAQLENAKSITAWRRMLWETYDLGFADAADKGIETPFVPRHCEHNGHCYYLILPSELHRTKLAKTLRDQGIATAEHYQPLHSSPAGLKYGRAHGDFPNTLRAARRLLRLPLHAEMAQTDAERVVEAVWKAL